MRTITLAASILGISLLLPTAGRCEFFQYTDKSGTIHFVEDESKIPKEYRSKKKTRQDIGGAEEKVMRVQIVNNSVLVPVSITYGDRTVKGTFLFDTGANVSTMTPYLAGKLKIPYEKTREVSGQLAGGTIVKGRRAKLDSIRVGPHTRSDFDVVVLPQANPEMHDGLLGMNFLKGLRYTIDFDNHLLTWE
jgi:hypothetical protein